MRSKVELPGGFSIPKSLSKSIEDLAIALGQVLPAEEHKQSGLLIDTFIVYVEACDNYHVRRVLANVFALLAELRLLIQVTPLTG